MERIASRQNPLVRRFRELAHAADGPTASRCSTVRTCSQEALRSPASRLEVVAFADRRGTSATCSRRWPNSARARRRARGHVSGCRCSRAMSPVRQPSGVVAIARLRSRRRSTEVLGQRRRSSSLILSTACRIPAMSARSSRRGGVRRDRRDDDATAPRTRSAGRRCAAAMGSTFRMPIASTDSRARRNPGRAARRRAARVRNGAARRHAARRVRSARSGRRSARRRRRRPARRRQSSRGGRAPRRSRCGHRSSRSTSRSPRR